MVLSLLSLWRLILQSFLFPLDLLSIVCLYQPENVQYTEDMTISSVDVSHLISQLKCGKAAGSDDLCAEYFNFAHHKLNVLLSLCFTLFFSHSYMPSSMIETIIVPIVKNKCGNLSDSNNYRLILHLRP